MFEKIAYMTTKSSIWISKRGEFDAVFVSVEIVAYKVFTKKLSK
jgi:hypothetical protein